MTRLNAQTRDVAKKNARALRREGLIPAEVYGHHFENMHLSVPLKEFLKTFKEAGESGIVSLTVDKQEIPVLIHDVSWNNVSEVPESIDFYAVRMDEKIKATVPLHFVGEAPVVREKNGVLVKVLQEVEVEALPSDLPRAIEVNLDALTDIGASIHVKDLPVSTKVKIEQDPEMVIVTASEAKEEEETPQGPASVEEIEVEEKGKKETGEEAEEKAAAASSTASSAKK